MFVFEDFILDPGTRTLRRAAVQVALQPKALDLLLYVLSHHDRYVSKDELHAHLWPDHVVGETSLAGLIREVRRALGDDGREPRIVKTLHGRGYHFVAQVTHVPNDHLAAIGGAALGEAPWVANLAPLAARTHAREARTDEPMQPMHYLQRTQAVLQGLPCVGARLQRALAPLEHIADAWLPVVLEGETSTGKSLIAHAIHMASGSDRAFEVIACATLDARAAQERLFGSASGLCSSAPKTLVLDRVDELPASVQARLSATLDDGVLTGRLRLIACTSRSLSSAASDGSLRSELAARLLGVSVKLPALRDRPEDVPQLLRHFYRTHARAYGGAHDALQTPELRHDLLETLRAHAWPFNLRELDALSHTLLLMHGPRAWLGRTHLPPGFLDGPRPSAAPRAEVARLLHVR